MYDIEELVSRLANGETEEALAAEMTNSLNEAIAAAKARKEEERKCNEAAKAAAHTEAAKNCVRDIILAISDYYDDIGEYEMSNNILSLSPKEIDDLAEMLESFTSLAKLFSGSLTTEKNATTAKKTAPKFNFSKEENELDWASERIKDFLASLK